MHIPEICNRGIGNLANLGIRVKRAKFVSSSLPILTIKADKYTNDQDRSNTSVSADRFEYFTPRGVLAKALLPACPQAQAKTGP
jgi:hypothetical protein